MSQITVRVNNKSGFSVDNVSYGIGAQNSDFLPNGVNTGFLPALVGHHNFTQRLEREKLDQTAWEHGARIGSDFKSVDISDIVVTYTEFFTRKTIRHPGKNVGTSNVTITFTGNSVQITTG